MVKKIIATGAIALSLPVLASADITSYTSATSMTGGNVVGPGGHVETGSASASVTSSSVSGHSSSSVYIETNANGEVHKETYSSGSANVDVSVQATPRATTVDIQEGNPPKTVKHDVYQNTGSAAASTSGSASASSSAATSTETASTTADSGATAGLGAKIVAAIQDFFAGIFGWFK